MPSHFARSSMLALVIMLAGCSAPAERGAIHVAELNQRPVIGRLGVGLGTVVEMEASVVAGSTLRLKKYQSAYLLKVTRVDGRPLAEPQVMEFTVPFGGAALAKDTFDLYKLKHKKEAGRLDSNEIAELERGYVAKTVRLAAYEVGEFSGMPSKLPKDVGIWQDVGFCFSTQLVVLAERE